MIVLAGVAFLIIVTVAWWLGRPLLRGTGLGQAQQLQLEGVRDRLIAQLDELDVDRADQGMDATTAADEQRRLEFELAQVLKQLESEATLSGAAVATPSRWRTRALLALFALGLPLIAVSLYALQSRDTLTVLATPGQQGEGSGNLPPMVLQMVARLEKQLAAQPDNAAGWAQLGRSYDVLGRKADAVTAYDKAYKLAPGDENIIAEYAWLLYRDNPTNTQGLVYSLYNALYKIDPQHQDAQWFLGLAAYQRGNYKDAVGFWEKLAAGLPAGSPAEQGIRKAIAQAKVQLKKK